MKAKLRLPAVLSVVVLTAAATAAVTSCGDDDPPPQADAATTCDVYCFPAGGSGQQNCPFPTCATGPNLDVCPADCDIGV
jgi:hypothetical protein